MKKEWTSEFNACCFWWHVKFMIDLLNYLSLYHNIHWRGNIASLFFFFACKQERKNDIWTDFCFFIIADPKHTNLWHRPKLKKFLSAVTRQFSLQFFSFNHCSHNFNDDFELSLWSSLLELRLIINITIKKIMMVMSPHLKFQFQF